MASVLRQTANAASEIASRAVHIKIWPRPSDLQESREILRVLQRFGEVTMFKTKRYDHLKPAPHTILAMFSHPDSASRLIRESPIKFTLEPDGVSDHQFTSELIPGQAQNETAEPISDGPSSSDSNPPSESHEAEFDTSDTSAYTPISPSAPPARDPAQTPPPTSSFPFSPWPRPPRPAKRFHLTADISLMNHSTIISRQERYGGFEVHTGSVGYQDLKSKVPLPGMSDVHTKRRETTSKEIRFRAQEMGSQMSLRELWEEGMRKKGKDKRADGRERGEKRTVGDRNWG
ncbi:hypothetical protein EV356DRAFT_501949 [Viridothelium virens]|uniref:Uncharacterized protein n=1 Tax=Viridothelium virens TaxID=1048519 RepID=A0A6A6HA23_VIRVR|nr:hypothetical protein EV356DRAFT_501949 [Viridothelium virens]